MSRYRKVDPKIWNDAKFMKLSTNAKLVFLFLLTHPHMTALGAMRANIPGLTMELGMTPEAFREAFRECFAEGCGKPLLEYDEHHNLVSLPNFIKYNKPESPNVVRAWFSAVDLIPECDLKAQVLRRAQAFAEGFGEGFAEAFGEAFAEGCAKAMPNQKQKQKQKQKQNKNPLTPFAGLTPDDAAKAVVPEKKPDQKTGKQECDEIVERAIEHLNLKTGRRFTAVEANAKLIRARIAEGATLKNFTDVIDLKTRQWLKDPHMNQYLRPATLFNAEKFHQYVGAVNGSSIDTTEDELNYIFGIDSEQSDEHDLIDAHCTEVKYD